MGKENISIFQIFGPVMIGPSSSHTAGVARIAFLARSMFNHEPAKAVVRFYGSLAATWKGHGSGAAVVSGLLGIGPEDERLSDAFTLHNKLLEAGKTFPIEILTIPDLPLSWHPNTLSITLSGSQAVGEKSIDGLEKSQSIRAASIGGGDIRIEEIDGYQVSLGGTLHALLVLHHDEIGVIAMVSNILAAARINIAATSSHRKEKGDEALLVIETDSHVPIQVQKQIESLQPVYRLISVPSLEQL